MTDYIELRLAFEPAACARSAADVAAALLADAGYESFVDTPSGLTAYIPAAAYSEPEARRVLDAMPIPGVSYTLESATVKGRDWNAEWERHYFQPIVVGDGECVVHASFHTGYPACRYDITIDPRMAFGTGHHATTSLIIGRLLQMPLQGLNVTDMGTGTGILAILCAMRGAAAVTAVEIDHWACLNAADNLALNPATGAITLIEGDASAISPGRNCDLFIANINRNVILADLPRYAASLKPGGRMLLSGFYTSDIDMLTAAAAPLGLVSEGHTEAPDGWACLSLLLPSHT